MIKDREDGYNGDYNFSVWLTVENADSRRGIITSR